VSIKSNEALTKKALFKRILTYCFSDRYDTNACPIGKLDGFFIIKDQSPLSLNG